MEMNTFQNYLNEPFSLDFHQMQSLHQELLSEIGNDTDAMEVYEDLVDAVTKYAAIRAGWLKMSPEEKAGTDPMRTACHNKVIVYLDMLARVLRMQGKKAAWREQFGKAEENPYTRKMIGDFGCYIVFVNSLCAR